MEFGFTREQEALRTEFEEFFKEAMKSAPGNWTGLESAYTSEEGWAFHRDMAKKLAEKGWLVRTWPRKYGGVEAPAIEDMILQDVAGRYLAHGIDVFGIGMLGPTLLAIGTEEQKEEHLPRIARGEVMWCQGWSEPDAGSDVAALTTSADREGDFYIVNGQKIWTTSAHLADWIFMVVRTDPESSRSRGLSLLMVDMKTPGITVRPVLHMDNVHYFNEVFFDNVKAPMKDRVGKENEGWSAARIVMSFERAGYLGELTLAEREVEDLIEFCKTTEYEDGLLIQNPLVRNQLAELCCEVQVGRTLMHRMAWEVNKVGPEASWAISSAIKLFSSQMIQRITYAASHILGLYGLVKEGSKWAAMKGKYEESYQHCIGFNIAAGSSEIQKNIIAWTALDLPRT